MGDKIDNISIDRLKLASLLEACYNENDTIIMTDFGTDSDSLLICDDPISSRDAKPQLEFDEHNHNSPFDAAADRDCSTTHC